VGPLLADEPNVYVDVVFYARGYLHAGSTTDLAMTLDAAEQVDLLSHTNNELKAPAFKREFRAPDAQLNGDLTVGVRLEFTLSICGQVAATVKFANEVRLAVDIDADPWWTVKGCYVVGIEIFKVMDTPFRHDSLFAPCVTVDQAPGTFIQLGLTPPRQTLRAGTSVAFKASSIVPIEPQHGNCDGTWTVLDPSDGDTNLIDNSILGGRCHMLVPGHAYVFFVRAVNSIGSSPEVQTNQVLVSGGLPLTGSATGYDVPAGAGPDHPPAD
jgi:hypothetical protein